MARIVMKFGGTSMAGIERIRSVAARVKREVAAGNQVAVVVSAMAGETDRLVGFCRDSAERAALWRTPSIARHACTRAHAYEHVPRVGVERIFAAGLARQRVVVAVGVGRRRRRRRRRLAHATTRRRVEQRRRRRRRRRRRHRCARRRRAAALRVELRQRAPPVAEQCRRLGALLGVGAASRRRSRCRCRSSSICIGWWLRTGFASTAE